VIEASNEASSDGRFEPLMIHPISCNNWACRREPGKRSLFSVHGPKLQPLESRRLRQRGSRGPLTVQRTSRPRSACQRSDNPMSSKGSLQSGTYTCMNGLQHSPTACKACIVILLSEYKRRHIWHLLRFIKSALQDLRPLRSYLAPH
jgi:hypothetical protein